MRLYYPSVGDFVPSSYPVTLAQPDRRSCVACAQPISSSPAPPLPRPSPIASSGPGVVLPRSASLLPRFNLADDSSLSSRQLVRSGSFEAPAQSNRRCCAVVERDILSSTSPALSSPQRDLAPISSRMEVLCRPSDGSPSIFLV